MKMLSIVICPSGSECMLLSMEIEDFRGNLIMAVVLENILF